MRKFTAVILLLVFATTNEVGQILKLPLLISHFIDHYKEEGQTVFAFMHEHYVHHHGENNDQDEDNRLPFKTSHIQQSSVTYLLPALDCAKTPLISISEKKITLPDNSPSSEYLKDIFHPPRIV